MDPQIRYEALLAELREIYKFESKEKFTLKWIDEEGKSEIFKDHDVPTSADSGSKHCCHGRSTKWLISSHVCQSGNVFMYIVSVRTSCSKI